MNQPLWIAACYFEGMNLVAKEFVACQMKEPGVLILSPFTGAGETMHEALLVNPLEETGLADTIHRALTMPLVSSLADIFHFALTMSKYKYI